MDVDDASNMVCFLALLASYRESVGYDVHHASAGGDRLIVMTTITTHCVPRCKFLMSLKHPEMLELSVKRLSVLSTERD